MERFDVLETQIDLSRLGDNAIHQWYVHQRASKEPREYMMGSKHVDGYVVLFSENGGIPNTQHGRIRFNDGIYLHTNYEDDDKFHIYHLSYAPGTNMFCGVIGASTTMVFYVHPFQESRLRRLCEQMCLNVSKELVIANHVDYSRLTLGKFMGSKRK